MDTIYYEAPSVDELYHHGIKGQKWGIRRYQNPNGTLTEAGMARYAKKEKREAKKIERQNEARKKIIAEGNAREAIKHITELSSQELQDVTNRARLVKQLEEMTGKKSMMKSISDAAAKVHTYGSNIANAIDTTKRLKKLLGGGPKKEEESEADKAYKENAKNAAKVAANKARNETKGSVKEKEAAASRVFNEYYDAFKDSGANRKAVEAEAKKKDTPLHDAVSKFAYTNKKLSDISQEDILSMDKFKKQYPIQVRMKNILATLDEDEDK